jgi:putative nucleotidyltransferase
MLSNQHEFKYHLQKFYEEKVVDRKKDIKVSIEEIATVVYDVLKEVEIQEPRFITQLNEMNGHYEGITVIGPNEFEIVLYLNQMGVFNFVDDNSAPGCALLKLSDGRKRSMSLWVEFITASGYLSARKIRARFHSLVSQACDKIGCRDVVKLISNNDRNNNTINTAANSNSELNSNEVRLLVHDKLLVHVVPAFKCNNSWPRGASKWPMIKAWPSSTLQNEVNIFKNNPIKRKI